MIYTRHTSGPRRRVRCNILDKQRSTRSNSVFWFFSCPLLSMNLSIVGNSGSRPMLWRHNLGPSNSTFRVKRRLWSWLQPSALVQFYNLLYNPVLRSTLSLSSAQALWLPEQWHSAESLYQESFLELDPNQTQIAL